MKELTRSQVSEILLVSDFDILISEDFSGHRIEWLKYLLIQSRIKGNSFLIICKDPSRIQDLPEDLLDPIYVFLFSGKMDAFEELLSDASQHNVMLWDADQSLFFLLKVGFHARCLIMRPYLTEFRIKSFFNYAIKMLLISFLIFKKKHEIRLLSIMGASPIIFKKHWVDDTLILDNLNVYKTTKMQNEGTLRIVIPGYITHRKNPQHAIDACIELRSSLGIEVNLDFLGSVEAKVIREIQIERHPWIRINNSYLEREEYLKTLALADMVLLPYSNRGSSGVVMETLALGGIVAIYKNRHWRNLATIASGQLILIRRSSSGIVAAVMQRLALNNQVRNPIILEKANPTALDFLLQIDK